MGGGQKFRNIMQTEPLPGTEGYVSTFVEMFSWVMTMPAYQALWELLFPSVNPYGWGYDFWYDKYAKARVPGHRMGIVGTVRVKHEQDFAAVGQGRTDNTRVEEKWQALVNQEAHYKAHFGVDLRKIREKLDLTNASWNGAVRGYLQTPPESFYAARKHRFNNHNNNHINNNNNIINNRKTIGAGAAADPNPGLAGGVERERERGGMAARGVNSRLDGGDRISAVEKKGRVKKKSGLGFW